MHTQVNVAPSSTEGHYVHGAQTVVDLDKEVTESFFVEGESTLKTKNHTSLEQKEDCLINCQVVYNPFEGVYRNSED